MKEKIVLCSDMDAFFASVEQKANPRLRGRPMAVSGSGKRTVVTAASYEARAFGVRAGMNKYEAKRLCPHIIFVAGDPAKYTHTCTGLKKIYERYTPELEIYSIDEAFLDLSTTEHLFGGPLAVGVEIKRAIRAAFGINATVGIGPNVLVAKLASDLAKPDGLRWIKAAEVGGVLEGLPLRELWGIGPRLARRLNDEMGVSTCGELGRAPVSLLRNKFGIVGEHLKAMGLGTSDRPLIVREEDPKSIGHGLTLPRDVGVGERRLIEAHLLRLSEMVGRRARRYGFEGRTISLSIRYPDFTFFSRRRTLGRSTNHTHEIYRGALGVLHSVRLRDRVRLIGVTLSSLEPESTQQSLFEEVERERALLRAVDAVNDRFGESRLTWASFLDMGGRARTISPSWRPSGVKNVDIR